MKKKRSHRDGFWTFILAFVTFGILEFFHFGFALGQFIWSAYACFAIFFLLRPDLISKAPNYEPFVFWGIQTLWGTAGVLFFTRFEVGVKNILTLRFFLGIWSLLSLLLGSVTLSLCKVTFLVPPSELWKALRMKRALKIIVLGIGVAFVLAMMLYGKDLEIDSCLDRGCKWNYEISECDCK